MIRLKTKVKPHKSVMYLDCLREVGKGGRLSNAMVLSFLAMVALRDNHHFYDENGRFDPTIPAGEMKLPDIPVELISASLGLSIGAVRVAMREIGGSADTTKYDFLAGFFELKTGLKSNLKKGKVTDTYTPLKGLAMVVYSYLMYREKITTKKNPMTKGVPVIDTWLSTLADETGLDQLAITRQIWKLESMGFVYRFYGDRHRPMLWINDKPKTSEEMLAILNKHYNGKEG